MLGKDERSKTLRISAVLLALFFMVTIFGQGLFVTAEGTEAADKAVSEEGAAAAEETTTAGADAGEAAQDEQLYYPELHLDGEAIKKELEALYEENKESTPSVSISVFGETEDICSVVYGNANVEDAVAADEDTIYEWGSVSKLLVWVSVMQLYEQGKLDMSEDITKYLPEDFLKYKSSEDPITMNNLINHDAGFLSPYKDVETSNLDELMPLDEALKKTEPAQVYEPGEVVAYSNWGTALAAYVVEQISGMDYAEYVKINILDRLGMEHTAVKPDLSDNPWVAERRDQTYGYYYEDEKLTSMGSCRAYIHIYPAGAVTGTIGDLKKFARAFLCNSEDSVLFEKPDTLELMLSPSLYYSGTSVPRFCHGFEADIYGKGRLILGHGGNTTGFTALLQFDPESRTGLVMMTNVRAERTFRSRLPEIVYGKPDYSEISGGDFTQLDFTGHYIMSGGTFEKGCFSLYSFLTDRLHIREQNGEYTSNSGISSIKQLSDNVAVVTLVNGEEQLYFIKYDSDGKFEGLQNTSVDFIRISNFKFTLQMVLMLGMILALVIMMVLLVAHLLKIRRFKDPDIRKYKLCEINLGIAEAVLASAISLLFLFGVNNMILRAIFCIVATGFLALMIELLIMTHRRSKKDEISKVLILEDVCGFFILVGFIYWRLYQFWGF